jgi:ABC-type glycerol-3-phosphate transport system permease component
MTNIRIQEETAISAVREKHAGATDFKVIKKSSDFPGGKLITVQYKEKPDNLFENYVHITKNEVFVYFNNDQLITGISLIHKKNNFATVISSSVFVNVISGIIALLIAITICYMWAVKDIKDIPEIFGNALTIILGFYFGSQVSKRTELNE